MTINAQTVRSSKARSNGRPTRREQLLKLLGRKTGATLEQIERGLNWKRQTARVAISTLRISGVAVERSVTDKGSVSRLATDPE